MSFISYAQNLEDVMLFRALKTIEQGFYIDAGAAEPVLLSVTKSFYERGWHGINIEPLAEYFQLLQQDRERDINLNVAVSSYQGEITFYDVSHSGMSTTNELYADQHASDGSQVQKQTISCTTLDAICDEYNVQTVHFLKIDVEGAEKAVLEGFTLQKVRPWIILIEANKPSSTQDISREWEPALLGKGYEFVYYDGLNRFYIAIEHPELRENFRVPPNIFDQYILYSDQLAQQNLIKERSHGEDLAKQLTQESASNKSLTLSLEQEHSQKESLVKQLTQESANKEALSAQLQQLRNSLSWRLTAPLRKGRNMLAAMMAHPASLSKKAIRKILRFMLRYEWILRLGRRVLRGHPEVRERLLGLAGLTTPYIPKTPLLSIMSVNNTALVTEYLNEPAREIYNKLYESYHRDKANILKE